MHTDSCRQARGIALHAVAQWVALPAFVPEEVTPSNKTLRYIRHIRRSFLNETQSETQVIIIGFGEMLYIYIYVERSRLL